MKTQIMEDVNMKTNTQHTPGPWKTSTGENLEGAEHRWISNGDRFIADLGKVGGQVDSESNARLIAAAPALLAAAELVDAANSAMWSRATVDCNAPQNLKNQFAQAMLLLQDSIAVATGKP